MKKTRIGKFPLRVIARCDGVVTADYTTRRSIYKSGDGKFWRSSASGRWQEVFQDERGNLYCHSDYYAVRSENALPVLTRVASQSEL